MRIGIPKEIKNQEERVSATPGTVEGLVANGSPVYVETGAGIAAGFEDKDYQAVGAKIVSQDEAWDQDFILKVKEPQPSEYKYFRPGMIIMSYLHLANEEELTQEFLKAGVTSLGYETMEKEGRLPLLSPMSEVAGTLAVSIGSQYLQKIHGGRGVVIGGVPGVPKGNILIIGGGNVGETAARVALGMGARVQVLDINPHRLTEIYQLFNGAVETYLSDKRNIARLIKDADIVIAAVLRPGSKAPVLVTEDMVKTMKEGAVVVDIAIDQGGNFETSDHETSHDNPTFVRHGVIHYCVGNIPGAVPRTASIALSNVSSFYVSELAKLGLEEAARKDSTIRTGINTYQGKTTYKGVAEAWGLDYTDINDLI